jgi:hypothetical protein
MVLRGLNICHQCVIDGYALATYRDVVSRITAVPPAAIRFTLTPSRYCPRVLRLAGSPVSGQGACTGGHPVLPWTAHRALPVK